MSGNPTTPAPQPPQGKGPVMLVIAVVAACIGGYTFWSLYDDQPPIRTDSPQGSLTPRKILKTTSRSPRLPVWDYKTGQVQAADIIKTYEIAKEIPAVLEKMPCYCGCFDPPSQHGNNYDCFTDEHGAG